GNHDTRFCYLGEQRLSFLEESLPDDAWVLGVDEHTALVFDLGAATATVYGRGVVTLRHGGQSVTLGADEVVPIGRLPELAMSASGGAVSPADASSTGSGGARGAPSGTGPGTAAQVADGPAVSPLAEEASKLSATFDAALAARDARGATEAVLAMEELVHGWAADTFESEDMDRARAELRRMVVRLGEAAGPGLADPREAVAPLVEALLTERGEARAGRRYGDADRVRDALVGAGVEVRDTPDGPEWHLR
ncbi:MAG TPA: hypothetical protein VFN61_07400, partial [Acidimicrobiales bacterium]|nr:hypothetical protein [Acidimicrobiales bacterium]